MNIVGYIRTTITEDTTQEQYSKLEEYGCTEFFQENSQDQNSAQLETLLAKMNPGDTLVVDRLFHLGKSTRQLSEWILHLQTLQIDLVCLTEGIDTREETGKLYFQWMNQMTAMESELLKERTLLGLSKARQQGKIGGRPKTDPKKIKKIRFLFFEKKESIQSIANTCNVSIGTCYKYINLKEYEVEQLLQK
ncbi:recombinase family protein [Enterococcus olivae]